MRHDMACQRGGAIVYCLLTIYETQVLRAPHGTAVEQYKNER